MIKDSSIEHFLDELASKSATPGGGSAAAVTGAMAAALVSMVCNLTLGKKNYEAVQDQMAATLARAEQLRTTLLDMIRADVEAFDRVMAAYGMPRDTDDQKSARSETIQMALRQATDVPLACAGACREVIQLSRVVAELGNRNVISDAGVAVANAHAALRSAALNVWVNTNAIRDTAFVEERLRELDAILDGAEAESNAIHDIVKTRL